MLTKPRKFICLPNLNQLLGILKRRHGIFTVEQTLRFPLYPSCLLVFEPPVLIAFIAPFVSFYLIFPARTMDLKQRKSRNIVIGGLVAFVVVIVLLDGFRMAHFALFFIHAPYRGFLFTKCLLGDCTDRQLTDQVLADMEYRLWSSVCNILFLRLRHYENKMQNENAQCPVSADQIGKTAWVTAMVNDASILIASVLSYTIDMHSCFPTKIAMISEDVRNSSLCI